MSPQNKEKDCTEMKQINGVQNVNIAVLQSEVNEIKNNHLVHLSQDIKELRTDMFSGFDKQREMINSLSLKMAYYAGGLAVLIAVARFVASFMDK